MEPMSPKNNSTTADRLPHVAGFPDRRVLSVSLTSTRSSDPSHLFGLAGPTGLRLNRMDLPCSRCFLWLHAGGTEPREHLRPLALSRPAIPPSPLSDRVGYSDHVRFRGYMGEAFTMRSCATAPYSPDAATLMGLGRRQVFRLAKAYAERGPGALVSRKRGRPSNRCYPSALRAE